MINIFMGREGVMDGEGVAVKDVKVGKGERCSEVGFEGVTSLPPGKF